MLYFLASILSFGIGVCVGLLAAFSGVVTKKEEHLKPLDPDMASFKVFSRPDKKENLK